MATTHRKLRSQNADPYQKVIHIHIFRDIKLYHHINNLKKILLTSFNIITFFSP